MPNVQLFSNPEAFTTPLMLLAFDLAGPDLMEWEPATIREFITKQNKNTPKYIVDRIQAGLGLIASDLFWTDPVTFGIVCRTLNRCKSIASDAPDMDDIIWGVTEATLIVSDQDTPPPRFSESVKAYIKVVMKTEGIVTNVPSLEQVITPNITDNANLPEMAYGRATASDDLVKELEDDLATKVVTCLKQVKDLNILLSEQAAAELEDMFTPMEV